MKSLKPILLTLIFLLICGTTQAQFLKKLAKKAEEKIKREGERRAERRLNDKIDKVFDAAENSIDGINTKGTEKEVDLPNSYHFDWKYTLTMETKNGDIKMHYLLKQHATYFGVVLVLDEKDTSKNSITVMDSGRDAYVILMDIQGQKMVRTMNLPNEILEDEATTSENFNLVKTDTKVILGYTCQGFKTQMKDGVMHMYIAKNSPISFSRAFGNTKNIPKGLNQKFRKELENGIMLEAEFISDKNKKNNFKTTCIELKKMEYTLDLSEYKSLKEFNTKN